MNDKVAEIGKKTNKKMMLLSCIGILLVVFGHTNNGLKFGNDIFPIYSFHMVLFVFISGYFYNEKNEDNLFKKDGYIVKKIKKLVITYFIWNLIYGIIVTIFRLNNIVSFGKPITFNTFFIEPWINGHQYIFNLSAWFILALFLVNIVYIIFRKCLKRIKVWDDYVFLFLFFIIALFSVYMAKNIKIREYYPIIRTGFFMFFYHLGYIYKNKIEGKFRINTIVYLLTLITINIMLIKIDNRIDYNMALLDFKNKYLFTPILAGITGVLFFLKISEKLEPICGNNKIINYIGNNTFDIMMHHLFWIFITNLIIFKLVPILDLRGFDVEKFRTSIYYFYTANIYKIVLFYTIIGISIPLIVKYFYEKIIISLNNKYIKKLQE